MAGTDQKGQVGKGRVAAAMEGGPGSQSSAVPAVWGQKHLPPESKSPTHHSPLPTSSSPAKPLPSSGQRSPPAVWFQTTTEALMGLDSVLGLCSHSLTLFHKCCSSPCLSPDEPTLLPTSHFFVLLLFGNSFQNVLRRHASSGTARRKCRYLDLLSDPEGPPSHVGGSAGLVPPQGKRCPFLTVSQLPPLRSLRLRVKLPATRKSYALKSNLMAYVLPSSHSL